LTANVVLDDGAVIYLNGVEGLRVRMNAGTPTYTTQANTVVSDASSIETFTFQSGTLTLGTNVLAVEVHQGGIPSSDIVWGMSLDAVKTITNAPNNKVALNELMANNVTITNNGTVTDWVELYNPSTNNIDLGGMSLSDDLANPRRFVFPAGSLITAGGYLVVHCDGDSPATTN